MIAGFKNCPVCGNMCKKVYSRLLEAECEWCETCKEARS